MAQASHLADDFEIKKSNAATETLKGILLTLLLYTPLVIWAIFTLFPFFYMLVMSTKSATQFYSYPPSLWFRADWLENLQTNYKNLLDAIPFWQNMWNSFYIAFMAMLCTLLFSSLGGFGFGMYDFKGKKLLFNIMLVTIMIPGLLNIIPFYIMMKWLGWINRPIALWFPGAASAYGAFLMKQYVESAVPRDLVDAARIDGSSEFGIYFRIIIPMIRPMLGSLGIITFIGSWNSYMTPLIILQDTTTMTVPIALNTLRGFASVDWGAVMMGASISVLPIAFIFMFFSKWIISSMTEGAIKD